MSAKLSVQPALLLRCDGGITVDFEPVNRRHGKLQLKGMQLLHNIDFVLSAAPQATKTKVNITVSSLRTDSLRLCWLEAFIAVEAEENISAAARLLEIDQSTASRYLIGLEEWLGKRLVEVGGVYDPDEPATTVALTPDGRDFHAIAVRIIDDLKSFRSDDGVKNIAIKKLSRMAKSLGVPFTKEQISSLRRAPIELINAHCARYELTLSRIERQRPVKNLKNKSAISPATLTFNN